MQAILREPFSVAKSIPETGIIFVGVLEGLNEMLCGGSVAPGKSMGWKPGCLAWTPHSLQPLRWASFHLIASVSSSVRNVVIVPHKTVVR